MDTHAIHVPRRPSRRHAVDIGVVITPIGRTATTKVTCRGWRTTNDHDIGVGRFNGVVSGGKHVVDIRSGVNLTSRPLKVNVHLIPHFNGIGALLGHIAQEGDIASKINAGGVGRARDAQKHLKAIGLCLANTAGQIRPIIPTAPFVLELHPCHARILHNLGIGKAVGLPT